MRYQKSSERRAVILMVVLSLLTLFALVGITFVLYADAEAAAARVAREAQTVQVADVNPQEALSFFLGQLIYDVPDTGTGVGSGLRGHSLARTMYGYQNPGLNVIPFNGVGRLHYPTASGQSYPTANPLIVTPFRNVPNNYSAIPGDPLDDYVMVNYTWFSGDNFLRDPERIGVRANPAIAQTNPYVGANAPYTYPDLNNFFLAAMKADGTVLTPSFHRPWLFQVATLNVGGVPTPKFYAFNDMSNPNWTNPQGKYLTLRPRPAEHPLFPLPGDATGDVKNLPWAPGGNDSIWIDLGAPVMTAPDGTLYKMMFAPLVIDLDNRINLNTAGNILAMAAAMTASSGAPTGPAAWQTASGSHVSNQGWGPWEVNLSKALWGDQALFTPSTPPTPPEWMRLLTGMSFVTSASPNGLPIVQPGVFPPTPLTPGLTAWLLPGVHGRYLETPAGPTPLYTPNGPPASAIPFYPSAISLNGTYQHSYAQSDLNSVNESSGGATPTARPILPLAATPTATSAFPSFALSGYSNGNLLTEATNHPLLYNTFQNPLTTPIATRAFRASDMESLLRPNASGGGPVDMNASSNYSDLARLCAANFGALATTGVAQRFRNLVTTQSWDVGASGVTPYWWNGMTTGYLTPNATNNLFAPWAAVPSQTVAGVPFVGFPPVPPTPTFFNLPGTNPITSEFGIDWRALSANSFEYYATTNPPGYTSPGAKIRLNRPLPPYPHMGALLTPPYSSLPPGPTASPYGQAYNLTLPSVANQYTAAQFARQALANDIYRRLLAITGLPAIPAGATPGASGNPSSAQLAPRRWLAQLAVNMVDYIDEDDIMTPFNFYTIQDNYGSPLATPGSPGLPNTSGPDDTTATGANPDYWVFGTELPKVVINEALATSTINDPATAGTDTVKVWVELYNPMPAVGGTNTQPQDQSSVPLFISIPGGGGYSPYRISISQYTMDQANPPSPVGLPAQLPDNSANVLGKAYVAAPLPQSTTDADFSPATFPSGVKLSQDLDPATTPLVYQPSLASHAALGTIAGVDAGSFFLVGPTADSTGYPNDPFVYSGGASPGLPINTPYVQTANMTYPRTWTASPSPVDERTSGLTVMLRRLANPYLPLQPSPALPNYNPYVTVDSINKVYLQAASSAAGSPDVSFGKTQPYAGLNLTPFTGPGSFPVTPASPVRQQATAATVPPGAVTSGYPGSGDVVNTFGYLNWPVPPSGHYDWLVHLDRQPISPMELLHVSAWPPYKLTQQFMRGTDATAVTGATVNTFAHYAPWFDTLPPGAALSGTTPPAVSCPWWFDTTGMTAGQSHRLYRLFEFLECGDRAFGVNGLGRIPGKVNINTVWDPEILHALIDGNASMGATATTNVPSAPLSYAPVNPATGLPWNPAPADMVSQIFANMMSSRSPNYYFNGAYVGAGPPPIGPAILPPIGPVNMGTGLVATGLDDRPFMPLSTGLYTPTTAVPTPPLVPPQLVPAQFPNGMSAITDTLLRTNNPPPSINTNTYPQTIPPPLTLTPATNTFLLFQNYNDPLATALTNSNTHPYYQTQLLTKLYNNITTRSNTFAVFLTVGFFQVIPGGAVGQPSVQQLGPEIGRAEGKQIRHRMFAIVDRTNMATFVTSSMTAVTGVTPNVTNATLNMTGNATIQLPIFPAPLTITGTVTAGQNTLLVPNLITGVPGVITAGTQLVIDAGNANEETVTVNSVTLPIGATPATINANFALPHAAGFSIIQRGNPGPWLLTPYDPRLDFGVVQYFSIID